MENIVGVVEILTSYANTTLRALPTILIALLVFAMFWGASRLVKKGVSTIAERTVDDRSLQNLFVSLAGAIVIVAGILVSAAIIFPGLNAGNLISVLGLSSVAVGFAFKDIFQNFFAGVLILARRPFHMGDQIVAGNDQLEGVVDDISFRHTTIRTYDNQRILIPNAQIFTSHIVIRNAKPIVRSSFFTGVSYDTNLEEAKQIIGDALSRCQHINQDHNYGAYVHSHGDNAVSIEVIYWHDSGAFERRVARDEVATKIKTALDQAQIAIPFPQRTLHLAPHTLDDLNTQWTQNTTTTERHHAVS